MAQRDTKQPAHAMAGIIPMHACVLPTLATAVVEVACVAVTVAMTVQHALADQVLFFTAYYGPCTCVDQGYHKQWRQSVRHREQRAFGDPGRIAAAAPRKR
jgi:hypothetical protein